MVKNEQTSEVKGTPAGAAFLENLVRGLVVAVQYCQGFAGSARQLPSKAQN